MHSVMDESFLKFVKKDVNKPAKTIIKLCPKENANNNSAPITIFLLNVVAAIIPAKTGVEQGVAARANTIPIIKAYK